MEGMARLADSLRREAQLEVREAESNVTQTCGQPYALSLQARKLIDSPRLFLRLTKIGTVVLAWVDCISQARASSCQMERDQGKRVKRSHKNKNKNKNKNKRRRRIAR